MRLDKILKRKAKKKFVKKKKFKEEWGKEVKLMAFILIKTSKEKQELHPCGITETKKGEILEDIE